MIHNMYNVASLLKKKVKIHSSLGDINPNCSEEEKICMKHQYKLLFSYWRIYLQ